MLAKCEIADSGLGAPFWFSAATNGKDCRNATYKHRIRNTPYRLLYGEKKDLSKCRPLGCRGYVHLSEALREKGKMRRGQWKLSIWASHQIATRVHHDISCTSRRPGKTSLLTRWCLMRVSSRTTRRSSSSNWTKRVTS